MKEKKGMRLFLYILAFVIIATGISYAFFSANFLGQKEYSIVLDQLIFRYTEVSQGITLDEPTVLTDEQGMTSSTYFDFDVYGKNLDNVPYLIYLEASSVNTLPQNNIKLYLTDQNDNEILPPMNFSDLKVYEEKENSYKLYREKIAVSNETDSYRLRMWVSSVDDSYTSTDTKQSVTIGGNFTFTVNVITPPPADIDKPVCTFAGPTQSVIYSTQTTNYTLTCRDDDEIVTTADELKTNLLTTSGLAINSVTRSGNGKKYDYTITVQGSTIGDKTLTLPNGVLLDITGNSSDSLVSSKVTILVDDTEPVIEIDGNPSSSLVNSSSTLTIPIKVIETESMDSSEFTASDITVMVDETVVTPTTKTLTYNGVENGIYRYTLTLKGLTGNGDLMLVAKEGAVSDAAGGTSIETPLIPNVLVDNTAPSCLLASTGTWETSQTLTITTTANDLNSNPYSFTSSTSGFGTTNTKDSVTKSGEYKAYVKDEVGNVGNCSYTVQAQTQYRSRTRSTSNAGKWSYKYCGSGYGSSYYGETYYQDWDTQEAVYEQVCGSYTYSGCSCSSSAHLCTTPYAIANYAGCNYACCTSRSRDCWNELSYYKYTCYRYGSWGSWSSWSTTSASTNYNNANLVHTTEAQTRVVYK